jgi:O-antigen/teichoic acid export membrane protein
LPVLLVAMLLVYVTSFFVQLAVCARAVPLTRRPAASVGVIRELFTYGGWMTLTSLLAPITMLSDRLVIGSRLGSAAVPIYTIPYNLVSRVIALPSSLSSASLPKLAGAPVEQEQALLTLGLRMLLAALMPLCVGGNLIMGAFLHFWVGDVIAARGTPVGCILVFGFWMHGVGHVPSTVIQARGRPDIVAKLLLVYVIPYFMALFAALHWFGIVGAAAVWAMRSSMDFWLFKWAPVPRAEAAQVALCSAIVLASSTAAILLDWRKPAFWIVLTGLLFLSLATAKTFAPSELFAAFRDRIGRLWPQSNGA